MIYFIQFLIIQIFIKFIYVFPRPSAYCFGVVLGELLYLVVKPRKGLILQNLKQAFNNKLTYQQQEKIIHQIYRNFCKTLIEFAKIVHWNKKTVGKFVQIKGLDNLRLAKEKGRGVILFTGHIGNWHIMGRALTLSGYTITNVIKRQKNPWVANWIAKTIGRINMKTIFQSKNSPREIIKSLRNNEIVEFLGDLHAGDEGVFVDFFGRPASTYMGPVVLAMRTGAPIVVAVDVRLKGNIHQVFIEEPIYLRQGKVQKEDVVKYLSLLTKRLEKYIIEYPNQWFWLHNRWKTQPSRLEKSKD